MSAPSDGANFWRRVFFSENTLANHVHVLRALKRARSLVQRGWCKFATAKDQDGEPVSCRSTRVAKVCALGAIWVATRSTKVRQEARILLADCNEGMQPSITRWNDTEGVTKRQVVSAFTKAIKHLEAK